MAHILDMTFSDEVLAETKVMRSDGTGCEDMVRALFLDNDYTFDIPMDYSKHIESEDAISDSEFSQYMLTLLTEHTFEETHLSDIVWVPSIRIISIIAIEGKLRLLQPDIDAIDASIKTIRWQYQDARIGHIEL